MPRLKDRIYVSLQRFSGICLFEAAIIEVTRLSLAVSLLSHDTAVMEPGKGVIEPADRGNEVRKRTAKFL